MKAASSRAFTLLELLVAVTITLLVAALMLTVTTGVLNIWRRTQAGHTQAMTSKQVLDLLEQDLQSAVYRRDSNRWLAADILDSSAALSNHGWRISPGLMKPANGSSLLPLPLPDSSGNRQIKDARFGLSGSWLRFVAINIGDDGSLPTVVSYQIARRPGVGNPTGSNVAPIRYSLYRAVVSKTATFERGYDVTSGNYASPNNNPFAAGGDQRAPRGVMNPGHGSLLASNVVDFGCWFHVRNPDGSLHLIYPSAPGDLSHQAIGNSFSPDSRFPEVADVMIRILTDEGAAQLEGIETGKIPSRPPAYATDADWWWAVVEANSKVFTRRIEIKGTAP